MDYIKLLNIFDLLLNLFFFTIQGLLDELFYSQGLSLSSVNEKKKMGQLLNQDLKNLVGIKHKLFSHFSLFLHIALIHSEGFSFFSILSSTFTNLIEIVSSGFLHHVISIGGLTIEDFGVNKRSQGLI